MCAYWSQFDSEDINQMYGVMDTPDDDDFDMSYVSQDVQMYEFEIDAKLKEDFDELKEDFAIIKSRWEKLRTVLTQYVAA